VRWQPVSPTLMSHLLAHWETRGTRDPRRQLLRYASGKPITARRYDHLWQRLGQHLPWVATQQITTHWLRHTTLTWVERNFGFAVAQAYAGHVDSGREPGATATYIRAGLAEVAMALAALTGEPHPLCPRPALYTRPSRKSSARMPKTLRAFGPLPVGEAGEDDGRADAEGMGSPVRETDRWRG
jgi:hypothetical protein